MSEAIPHSASREARYYRIDEIRCANEDLIDQIYLAQAARNTAFVKAEEGYLVTSIVTPAPFGPEGVRGVNCLVELKRGTTDSSDRYKIVFQDFFEHENGITELTKTEYRFNSHSDLLDCSVWNSDGEEISWSADRGEELDIRLYLFEALQAARLPLSEAA